MKHLYLVLITLTLFSCRKEDNVVPLENTQNEDLSAYQEIASINLGGLGAAEITAFDLDPLLDFEHLQINNYS